MKPKRFDKVANLKTVTYTTKSGPEMVWITAHLPPGFTMREYTYCFFWSTADDLKMTREEYLIFEQKRITEELMNRIAK